MELFDSAVDFIPSSRTDDDTADRLNHRWTVVILIIFALIVVDQQFIHGSRIVCWVPAHFSDNHEAYTQDYCWVRNTYYLPMEQQIPHEEEDHKRWMIPYYQWVPVILCLQAVLFHLPCTLWRSVSGRSGLDTYDFVEKAQALPLLDQLGAEKLHQKTLSHLATLMNRFIWSESQDKNSACTLSLKHIVSRTCLLPCSRGRGRYLITFYMFCKLLYIANILGQLFLLDRVLGNTFHSYGFDVLNGLANDKDWTESRVFPRITMCDFKVRRLGNIQRYTVQCVLPINLFNEKFFLVIYFWMLIVGIITLYSFFNWCRIMIPSSQRKGFIARNIVYALKGHEVMEQGGLKHKFDVDKQKKKVKKFVEKYLKQDGVFVLRLTQLNVDPVTEADLVLEIYKRFREEEGDPIKIEADENDEDDDDGDSATELIGNDTNPAASMYPRLSQINVDPAAGANVYV